MIGDLRRMSTIYARDRQMTDLDTLKPLTEAQENHLQFLQARYARLGNDWAYSELCKFVRQLERAGH